jgi:Tfp pilus assembly protein PilN
MVATAMLEPEPLGDVEETPEGEPSPRRNPMRLILWLIVAAVALFLIPTYLVSVTVRDAVPEIDIEITALAETIAAPASISAEQEALESELLNVRGALNALQPPLQSANAAHVDWPQTMAVIGSYDMLRITLQRVTQSSRQISVAGQALSQTAVTAYADTLRASGLFSRVVILAIDAVTLPTPAPVHEGEVPPFPVTVANFTLLLELLPPVMEASNATE